MKSEFEEPLVNTVNEIIKKYGKALVLWIHGIDDKNLIPDNTEENVEGMDALIGIGQGAPDSLTADQNTVEKLIDALQTNNEKRINVALARKGSDYCGRHENNLNQLFIGKYALDQVESIQLEIRETGFREDDNYRATARALADASAMMNIRQPYAEPDKPILDSLSKTMPSDLNLTKIMKHAHILTEFPSPAILVNQSQPSECTDLESPKFSK